jgi:hypothetical protein
MFHMLLLDCLVMNDLSSTFSVENWVPLKPMLGGVRDVALFHYPHAQTQSNRVCNFRIILLLLMLRRDHTFFPDICSTLVLKQSIVAYNTLKIINQQINLSTIMYSIQTLNQCVMCNVTVFIFQQLSDGFACIDVFVSD